MKTKFISQSTRNLSKLSGYFNCLETWDHVKAELETLFDVSVHTAEIDFDSSSPKVEIYFHNPEHFPIASELLQEIGVR